MLTTIRKLLGSIRDRLVPERKGRIRIRVQLVARDADGNITGERCLDDLATKQLAQFVQALVLASTQTITDTGGTGRSVANASATTAPTILAGTGSTAAAYNDTALGTQTETVSGTVNAYSGSGTSGSFTVTGTITAGADRAYAEVGLRCTNGGNTFLLCRDVFSVLNVSNTGTLAVTYTLTFS